MYTELQSHRTPARRKPKTLCRDGNFACLSQIPQYWWPRGFGIIPDNRACGHWTLAHPGGIFCTAGFTGSAGNADTTRECPSPVKMWWFTSSSWWPFLPTFLCWPHRVSQPAIKQKCVIFHMLLQCSESSTQHIRDSPWPSVCAFQCSFTLNDECEQWVKGLKFIEMRKPHLYSPKRCIS